jgi:hypothetical protein
MADFNPSRVLEFVLLFCVGRCLAMGQLTESVELIP